MNHKPFAPMLLLSLALTLVLLGGCVNSNMLSSEQATGTAIVAQKYTAAVELTTTPETPVATSSEIFPTLSWMPSPGEIVASDSGMSYNISITSRITIELKEADYPQANVVVACQPPDILGGISNVPPVPDGYYALRYESTALGSCVIRNGNFKVTINVIEHP